MAYLKVALSGVAAAFVTLLGPGLFHVLMEQKATGFAVVQAMLLESLLSPWFWLLAILLFGLFFAASRLSNKALRILLFWTPTIVLSTLGFVFVAFLAYVWIHFRRG